jgi:hypothetical protein
MRREPGGKVQSAVGRRQVEGEDDGIAGVHAG